MSFFKKMIEVVKSDILQQQAELPFTEMEDNYAMEAEQSVTLSFYQDKISPVDSKIGGIPFMPHGFKYPMDERNGRKGEALAFLAQINFAQLPPMPGFPKNGILQFYVATDTLYGLDMDDPIQPKGFRVIYLVDLYNESHCLKDLPVVPDFGSKFPVSKELKMGFTPDISVISYQDFRYEGVFLEAYQKAFPFTRDFEEIPILVREKMEELCDSSGSRIGGFPLFTQEDPRHDKKYEDYSILLFQMDSDKNNGIEWGDNGVCNFFITPEQLENKDFSKVLYHWDCY